ncbi:MAG: DDE-type integrase/transposase/recombinase [Tetragenococcus koreensis]|nr:DDE-type integrase/transposase/recombinase [Tetragenococcus koreensis]MDN6640868.1 DDE-type integrase/transposase/recombinase [Tetragenococcus sp.]MDN6701680.1 DDE-type integrase/transposase/recombinase [Tetragenococcus koreensis]
MSIITEEMRYRKKVVEYATKHNNNALAARRYYTSRMQVKRWRDKYDGSWKSLKNRSRRPHSHPNQHTEAELTLIQKTYQRYGHEGLAQVFVECNKRGYKRSYDSMCKQIRDRKWNKKRKAAKRRYPKSKWRPDQVTFPGEKVQIDIKYVPRECLAFDSHGIRYYQITAIDEYSRKRHCKIVDEKSVTHTAHFMLILEKELGFKIHTVQTDNGREFINDREVTKKETIFEQTLKHLGIKYKNTRPYSPWQNGKVERSHREDQERFYDKRSFQSVEDMHKQHKRYMTRENNIARKVLNFLNPNQLVKNYFAEVA